MIKEIKQEKERLQTILDEMERRMRRLPKGRLKCATNKGVSQYYIDGAYVKRKQQELVSAICEREYYEKLYPEIEDIIQKWEKVLDFYEENKLDKIYDKLCEGRKQLLARVAYETENQVKEAFEKAEYTEGEFDEQNSTEYYTIKGERVRSKSEKIIADELTRRGIPYKYEKPLILEERGKMLVIRPDFTILNTSNRKQYILEHFGMMDDPNYIAKAMTKMNTYEKNGYLLGKNLIILRESSGHPLNIKILEKYIEEYFIE